MAPRQNSSHEKELKEVLHGGIHVQCFPCSVGYPSSLTFSIYPTNYISWLVRDAAPRFAEGVQRCKSRLSREMNCDVYGEARMFAFYAMLSDRVSKKFCKDFHDICELR